MIFVTVGTHEQPFNRLIQKIDELKKDLFYFSFLPVGAARPVIEH